VADENQLGNNNIFRVNQGPNGELIYMHNNEVIPKEVFDQRKQESTTNMDTFKNAKVPGIDDDPDIAAMRARAKQRSAPKKTFASGGYVKSADGIAQRGKTKGRMC